jgi:hypothetical protein
MKHFTRRKVVTGKSFQRKRKWREQKEVKRLLITVDIKEKIFLSPSLDNISQLIEYLNFSLLRPLLF